MITIYLLVEVIRSTMKIAGAVVMCVEELKQKIFSMTANAKEIEH